MVLYSIIIPTYEEKENIDILISSIDKYLTKENVNFEIIVVDDNSPDGTKESVIKMQKLLGEEKVKLLNRKGKLGLGTAYIDGFDLTKGDFIFLMDADFSHHPKFLISYIKKQKEENSDIVTGSRYINGGGVYGWNLFRKLVSRGANFFASFFLNPNVSDLTGSFRLYKREIFIELISKVKNVGYAFQMEIIVRAIKSNLKISEVPITFVDRIIGSSKLSTKEIFIYFQTVMKLYYEL